jgi:hypothetical protein
MPKLQRYRVLLYSSILNARVIEERKLLELEGRFASFSFSCCRKNYFYKRVFTLVTRKLSCSLVHQRKYLKEENMVSVLVTFKRIAVLKASYCINISLRALFLLKPWRDGS